MPLMSSPWAFNISLNQKGIYSLRWLKDVLANSFITTQRSFAGCVRLYMTTVYSSIDTLHLRSYARSVLPPLSPILVNLVQSMEKRDCNIFTSINFIASGIWENLCSENYWRGGANSPVEHPDCKYSVLTKSMFFFFNLTITHASLNIPNR